MGLDDLYPGDWALLLVDLCGPKHDCASPGKTPHMNGWQRHALARYDEGVDREKHLNRCSAWVKSCGGNLGLCIPPHVVALDVDASPEAVAAIQTMLPDYPTQRTANGVHVLAASHVAEPQGNHYGNVPVTLRKARNQIVVAPSVHASGHRYEWLTELPYEVDALPYLDPTLLIHVPQSRTGAYSASSHDETQARMMQRVSEAWLRDILDTDVTFGAGSRHEAMLWYAWHLVVATDGEITGAELGACTAVFSEERCVWGDRRPTTREIMDICNGAFRRWQMRRGMER